MKASTTMVDLPRAIYEGLVFAHRADVKYLLTGPDAAKPNVSMKNGLHTLKFLPGRLALHA